MATKPREAPAPKQTPLAARTSWTPHAELAKFFTGCRKAEKSDIGEHMFLLAWLSSQCEHVTEFGTRWASGSTTALLTGQPDTFITWDIDFGAIVNSRMADLNSVRGRTNFQARVGNSLEVLTEETDLLFIDTLHTAKQLYDELDRHGWSVRKWIVIHDTETFGQVGEDGSTPGLRLAIRKFQKEVAFPLWKLKIDRKNCNGLVVLERIDVEDLPGYNDIGFRDDFYLSFLDPEGTK